ncbi:MAG: hypothetical protein Q8916_02595 [Bacteroidota bacterium]|nr:hypothetical protein [Bacteroidota bacterium]MDP4229276.1 hypothetical protein [Bacteroidota bacterium]MDP4234899.1 hypothetical protein [Bacteroidota bacterium]
MKKDSSKKISIGRVLFPIVFAAVSMIYVGCSSSTSSTPSSTNQSTINTYTAMDKGTVTSSAFQDKSPAVEGSGSTADSIVITRARIVISSLKMHTVGDADDDSLHHFKDGDPDVIKAGPFIAEFDSGAEKIISTITIPPGTYDRIKFEIHKLNENEDQSLLNDPLFGDFVNGGRYTFIIDGFAWVNGTAYAFSFKSSQTDNVTVFLDPPAVFDTAHVYDLRLIFNPKLMFGRTGLRPLDPRDPDNIHAIEGLLKKSIRALRTSK